jgi:hypothetical protein
MTQFKILGAAALLASALATPAMAQQTTGTAARCSDAYHCRTMRPGYGPDAAYHRRAYRQDPNWQDSNNRYDPGIFAPVDAAAGVVGGVVGGAVGTAAAVATAPFGGPDYYARGQDYARLNGFVCTPGTWFRGDDGLRHPCQ